MTGTEIYEKAITSLGYSDDDVFKRRAVVCLNQIYEELFNISGLDEFKPIKTLSEDIGLPKRMLNSAIVYGLAERLALGEGDGERQQYFARQYDRAKARFNRIDSVEDTMPR